VTISEHAATASASEPDAYVWAWLPGETDPVVAGALARTGRFVTGEPVLVYTYGRSYLNRADAISLFTPELPLSGGAKDPSDPQPNPDWRGYSPDGGRRPLSLASCLRDAAPDAWGRRVLNARLASDPDTPLAELTYLLESGSDRIGALDFQRSSSHYAARGHTASLDQLVRAAEFVESGEPIPEDLAAAALHGSSIGGARPKALLEESGRHLIAKFSSATDDRPVVKAEAVAMLLAARCGINAASVEVVEVAGRSVLLVERFDRTETGGRRGVVSALTVLGLDELSSRYSSYAELATAIRFAGWERPADQLRELYARMVFNIAVSNTDDHLRNHAAFWEGRSLELTPAYDLCPQRRSTTVATHAIALGTNTDHTSQFRVARRAAGSFGISDSAAADVIDHICSTIRESWRDVCDEARLSRAEAEQLWGREILNDYAFWEAS
jgi:serine/threonine-protein kinase HipA